MSEVNFLENFRHHITIDIRFADMDAMGHVNNAVYMTYMETGRIHYFRELNLFQDRFEMHIGPILAKSTIDYRLPLTLDDNRVEVYSRVTRLGNKSYDMEHLIVCDHNGQVEIAAQGQLVLVAYDYRAGHSVILPKNWREGITAYEPGMNKNHP